MKTKPSKSVAPKSGKAMAAFTKLVLDTFRALPSGVSPVYARVIAAVANGGEAIVIEGVDAATLKGLEAVGFKLEPTGGVNNATRIRWEQEEVVRIVLFRVSRRDREDVYALLPEEQFDHDGCVTCYQHVGGHCGADYYRCIRDSRPATPAEYAELKLEMERRGYRLHVAKRCKPFFRK